MIQLDTAHVNSDKLARKMSNTSKQTRPKPPTTAMSPPFRTIRTCDNHRTKEQRQRSHKRPRRCANGKKSVKRTTSPRRVTRPRHVRTVFRSCSVRFVDRIEDKIDWAITVGTRHAADAVIPDRHRHLALAAETTIDGSYGRNRRESPPAWVGTVSSTQRLGLEDAST